jgi:hypothetical protein
MLEIRQNKYNVSKLTQVNGLNILKWRKNIIEGTRQINSVTSGKGRLYKVTKKRR